MAGRARPVRRDASATRSAGSRRSDATLDAIGFRSARGASRCYALIIVAGDRRLPVRRGPARQPADRPCDRCAPAGFDPTQKLLDAEARRRSRSIVVAFFVGIDLLDIDLTTFAVFSGALGLAVGFGLQKTIGNLIAGIILLMDRSIKPGDVIVVGDKDVGWVNKIGVRAVSVVTRDGKEHLIPNEDLMTKEVENWSYTDRNVRIRIPVDVAYDCDLQAGAGTDAARRGRKPARARRCPSRTSG